MAGCQREAGGDEREGSIGGAIGNSVETVCKVNKSSRRISWLSKGTTVGTGMSFIAGLKLRFESLFLFCMVDGSCCDMAGG